VNLPKYSNKPAGPPAGLLLPVCRLLRLAEKQFNNIFFVIGEADYQEKTVGSNCHIMI
jgi:CRISPR/Cas system-associated protein endoribonuclease Cas2